MTAIRTRIRVGRDHRISGTAPAAVPAGEHEATIAVSLLRPSAPKSRVADLPTHDLPWDDSLSLRRDDIYGDDGR